MVMTPAIWMIVGLTAGSGLAAIGFLLAQMRRPGSPAPGDHHDHAGTAA